MTAPKKKKRTSWAWQLQSIRSKGREAFKSGETITTNPYAVGESGGTGISCPGGNLQRQRAVAWRQGWELGEAE